MRLSDFKKCGFLTLLTVLFFWPQSAASGAPEIYSGRVISVQDGDTLTLQTVDFERLRVRFYGIDAPEKNQSMGPQSAEALKKLVDGRDVTVEVIDTDRYSRAVALVRLDQTLINLTMVEEGWAWLYPQYCKLKDVCTLVSAAEQKAKNSGLGLWREKDPTPPWQWRRNKRQ
ncbi:MAG: thermonuclease family protein [Deltaproteobacteria bacterium]|nr:thermonuclease family protein [Deltaproteobacteria bacterium]